MNNTKIQVCISTTCHRFQVWAVPPKYFLLAYRAKGKTFLSRVDRGLRACALCVIRLGPSWRPFSPASMMFLMSLVPLTAPKTSVANCTRCARHPWLRLFPTTFAYLGSLRWCPDTWACCVIPQEPYLSGCLVGCRCLLLMESAIALSIWPWRHSYHSSRALNNNNKNLKCVQGICFLCTGNIH